MYLSCVLEAIRNTAAYSDSEAKKIFIEACHELRVEFHAELYEELKAHRPEVKKEIDLELQQVKELMLSVEGLPDQLVYGCPHS